MYKYVEDTKVSVSIKKINANKCTLNEIFLSEIFKPFLISDFNVIFQNVAVLCYYFIVFDD